MNYLLIALVIMAVFVLLANVFSNDSKEKKLPGGNCRNCPEFQYCGGGKRGCGRRGELKK